MRITRKALRESWRDPAWEFHHETTYWYPLDDRHLCLCSQDTEIRFSERSGIGYDVAVPGSYTVFVDEVDGRRTVVRSVQNTFRAASHRELKREAIAWIYDQFKDEDERGEAA